jgi:hypothetical protein
MTSICSLSGERERREAQAAQGRAECLGFLDYAAPNHPARVAGVERKANLCLIARLRKSCGNAGKPGRSVLARDARVHVASEFAPTPIYCAVSTTSIARAAKPKPPESKRDSPINEPR